MKRSLKVRQWEAQFAQAKTTYDRRRAAEELRHLVGDQHPAVQAYLNRYQHRPDSGLGWWVLGPETPRAGMPSAGASAGRT